MYRSKQFSLACFTGLLLILAGCSTNSTDPVRVEMDYGNSVRNMVDAQIYDQAAANSLQSRPVIGIDGVKAEGVIESYHADQGKTEEVREPIRFNIE